MQRHRILGLATIAAMAAVAGLGTSPQSQTPSGSPTASSTSGSAKQPAKPSTSQAAQRADLGILSGGRSPHTRRSGYPNGPGWSNRHVQRMARKRRNQQRHRKACRG